MRARESGVERERAREVVFRFVVALGVKQQVAEQREPFGLRQRLRAQLRVEVERARQGFKALRVDARAHVRRERGVGRIRFEPERLPERVRRRAARGEQLDEARESRAACAAFAAEYEVSERPSLRVEEFALARLEVVRRLLVNLEERAQRYELRAAKPAHARQDLRARRDAAAVAGDARRAVELGESLLEPERRGAEVVVDEQVRVLV